MFEMNTTSEVSPEQRSSLPPGHYGLVGLLRSEWTKLRTVRSSMWTLVITLVLGVGIAALATAETRAHWSTMSLISRAIFDPTGTSLAGLLFGQLTIGILGVLVMSAEYSTGTIRATFAAAPHRLVVLVAKVVVFGVVALIVSELVAFLSFFLGQALLTSPAFHTTISSPGALRQVIGGGLYLDAMGLFGLGLATIIRHTAAAISTYVGILLVLPIIVHALPESIRIETQKFLPDHIGAALVSLSLGNSFTPWSGFLLLCAYVVALLVFGGVLLVRRDT